MLFRSLRGIGDRAVGIKLLGDGQYKLLSLHNLITARYLNADFSRFYSQIQESCRAMSMSIMYWFDNSFKFDNELQNNFFYFT